MPNPKPGENKKDYISRCMAYDDMQKYDEKQRYAICNSMYESKKALNSLQSIKKSLVLMILDGVGTDENELAMGIEEELKDGHTMDRTEAEKIALDHLRQDPKYYTKLRSAGL